MERYLHETLQAILTHDYPRIESILVDGRCTDHTRATLARYRDRIRFPAIPDYLANSRMHRGAKTIYERETVFQASMKLLERHYGYVPVSWVFGYTTWKRDGRDQFFSPMRPTARNYLASLPVGLRL